MNTIQGCGSYGDALLHTACLTKNMKHVRGLIEMGFNVTYKTKLEKEGQVLEQVTPLHIAILKKNPEIFGFMLQSISSITDTEMHCKIEDDTLWSVLKLAIEIADKDKGNNSILVGNLEFIYHNVCLLYTSPSPRDS